MPRALLIAIALAAGCGDNQTAPAGADAAPPADAGPCVPVVGEPELALEVVAGGFDKPVYAGSPPGDPRIFVLEQHTGLARIIDGGLVLDTPFLDVGDDVSRAMEQGLLSLAFHPRFAENRTFYLSYTRGDDALVVEEWQVSATDADRADRGSRRQVLVIPQSTNFHHGGRIAFGPDGYLYLGHGDGGPQHDPDGNAQDLGKLLGKFLRLDVDARDPGLEYAIPPDNPFVGVAGARGEIYAYGVRNPWGWSIDPATGHLYFGDVGLAKWEEIDVIPRSSGPGANYGWPILMGNDCELAGCDKTGLTPPLVAYAYSNQAFCAVVGGPVYRGCRMPGHHGRFFYSDFCAGFVRSFRWSELDPEIVQVTEHAAISGVLTFVSAIGVDGQGELLLADWDTGQIHRVVPAP